MQGTCPDYATAAAVAGLFQREFSSVAVAAALKRQNDAYSRAVLRESIAGLQAAQNGSFISPVALNGIQELLGIIDGRSYSVPPSVDPILLANAIAAERQIKLVKAAEQKARIDDAYKRGREEALMSLVSSGALGALSFQQAAVYQQVQRVSQMPLASTHSQSEGILPMRQEASSPVVKSAVDTKDASPGDSSHQDVDRRKAAPSYFDASELNDPDAEALANRRTRGGVTEPFPEKLHRMLKEVEAANETAIISFFPHGRAFAVHNPTRFVTEVMPKFFRQSRLSSFQRQLNLYGFTRISSGPDAGGYYHELFLKGRPALSIHMRRVGVPQAQGGNNATAAAQKFSGLIADPNFYDMPPIKGEATAGDEEMAALR